MRYNPWWDANERHPDIHIEWHPIYPVRAAWCPTERVILVDEDINDIERRCALAHELAHIDTADAQTALCWFSSRQETAADRLAAERLVGVDEIADALRWTNAVTELAQAVGVTPNVLRLRARMLSEHERARLNAVISRRDSAA